MQMVAADWIRSDKREDNLAGRYGGIVQVLIYDHIAFIIYAEIFFVIISHPSLIKNRAEICCYRRIRVLFCH